MNDKLKRTSIFLAGDSLVQSYEDDEFIGGWGQYLSCFFDRDKVNVKNFAKGGRSSRSFINEGRLENIMKEISKGDYLFIEFCHNDDDTKNYETMYNRLTPLGKPDENGIYPTIAGEKIPTNLIPKEYFDCMTQELHYIDHETVQTAYDTLHEYGETYYPYSKDGVMGTYKWFLLQYVELARSVGAIPIIVTAPPRASFDDYRRLSDGPGLHGGENYAYIRAAKQLAKEHNVILIDIFKEFKDIFETMGKTYSHYITSIKTGNLTGHWPEDFENALDNPYIVSEDTHFNKFGAYLLAAKIAENISIQASKGKYTSDLTPLKSALLNAPSQKVAYPTKLEVQLRVLLSFFKYELV